MGDFFAPPPGYPDVPPSPSTPPPDFEAIGKTLGIGLSESGAGTGLLSSLFDILVRWFTYIVGLLLQLVLKVVAFLINVLTNVESDAAAGYGQVVAATLKNLLGVTVDPSVVSSRTAGPGRQAAANAMTVAILGTLFPQPTAAAGGGIPPSQSAVNNYLAVGMNMELNGWIESWFADAATYHLLEKYGELKDGIVRILGLGRLSRQVLAPPVKVFVHDPYLALLNNTYRPKAVDAGTAMQAFLRAEFDRDMLSSLLGPQGYQEQEIDWLIRQHTKYLSVDDLNWLIQRQQWSTQQAVTYLGNQGYDPQTATNLLAIAADKELQSYRKQAIAVAEASYVDGNLDQASFQNLVSGSGLTEVEQSWINAIANLKRQAKVTHLSRGDIETGILDGVMSFSDLKTWATRNGMPADEEAFLELEILFKQNKETATAAAKAAAAQAKAAAAQAKAQAAAEKAAAAKAQAADKGVTVSQAETLVEDGFWTFDQLEAFLTAKGYGADAINSIVKLLQTKISTTAAKTAAATTAKAAAGAKGLSLAETEKAVVAGILTIQGLENYLSAHGFDAADATTIVDLTKQAIATAATKAAAKAAATTKAASKGISLPEIEHAVRLGLTPLSTYNNALQAAGFDAADITLLDGILNAQIATDKETAAKRAPLAAAGAAAGVSISQIEQEVLDGIRPIGDYISALSKLGYSVVDQQQLGTLLQLKLAAAKTAAQLRNEKDPAVSSQGLSLSQLAAAVKLGVAPISLYQQELASTPFNGVAQSLLLGTLQAEVAKTKTAQTAANAATTALATKHISLPEIEQAVINGIEPISDYTSTLTSNGYSAADAQTLTSLLQLKVDHAAAVAKLHVDADGKATQKGISLANLEASVVAGTATMAQYDTVLTDLGYDSVDRQLLEGLLQTKVTAAAAKAGTTTPAPTGGTGTAG